MPDSFRPLPFLPTGEHLQYALNLVALFAIVAGAYWAVRHERYERRATVPAQAAPQTFGWAG